MKIKICRWSMAQNRVVLPVTKKEVKIPEFFFYVSHILWRLVSTFFKENVLNIGSTATELDFSGAYSVHWNISWYNAITQMTTFFSQPHSHYWQWKQLLYLPLQYCIRFLTFLNCNLKLQSEQSSQRQNIWIWQLNIKFLLVIFLFILNIPYEKCIHKFPKFMNHT
jgi:hypothetical protein